MGNSRGLLDTVVRALAKVGLVWALAVLATIFVVVAAQGQEQDHRSSPASAAGAASPSVSATSSSSSSLPVSPEDAPRAAGIALALFVLASGIVVLAAGAMRDERAERELARRYEPESDPSSDLPLALGLGLLA